MIEATITLNIICTEENLPRIQGAVEYILLNMTEYYQDPRLDVEELCDDCVKELEKKNKPKLTLIKN